MEENNKINDIIDIVRGLTVSLKNFEDRLVKNEQLVLNSFSYLYSRQDNLHCDENFEIIDNNIHQLKEEQLTLNQKVNYLKENYSNLIDKYSDLENQYLLSNKKPHKIKRPWHYFISKHFKYRKVLKERKLLHEQQRIAREEQLKREEEEQKARLEQERLEKIRREEREKIKAEERRRLARQKMSGILSNLK